MKLQLTIMFLTVLTASAQNKGDFTFELEAGRIHYNNMEATNRFLRDTTDNTSMWFGNTYINDTLKKSPVYGLSLNYQPLNFMNFGFYGFYQSKRFKRPYNQIGTVGDPFYNQEYVIGHDLQKVNISSLTVGLSTTIYLNKLFRLESYSSKFLKRFQFGIVLKGGVSFSSFEIGQGSTGLQFVSSLYGTHNIEGMNYMDYTSFRSMNWSGNIEFKLGYRIIDSNLFSTIGIKAGYQFHTTPVLKNKADRPFIFGQEKEELKLNFSGLYYGVYLNIGK